jgi:hypothetical protein
MPIPDSASTEVLSWWRKHEKHLPMLAKEARKFLSIVVSSASSERTFSLAGQTVSDQRTKLDPINVDKIVTLRANLRFLKQQNPTELETEEETLEREVTFIFFKLQTRSTKTTIKNSFESLYLNNLYYLCLFCSKLCRLKWKDQNKSARRHPQVPPPLQKGSAVIQTLLSSLTWTNLLKFEL